MPYTIVQSKSVVWADILLPKPLIQFDSPVTAGNAIFIFYPINRPTTVSVGPDNLAQTITGWAYKINLTGGQTLVTEDFVPIPYAAIAFEVSGVPVDYTLQYLHYDDNPSVTTTHTNELVIAAINVEPNTFVWPTTVLTIDFGSVGVVVPAWIDPTDTLWGESAGSEAAQARIFDATTPQTVTFDASASCNTGLGTCTVSYSIMSFASSLTPPQGGIVVNKVTDPPGSPQSFDFTPMWGAPFSLTDGNFNFSGFLTPGIYSVVEAPVAGWTTTTDIDPANIPVIDGEFTQITFTNTSTSPPTGNIIVQKVTEPNTSTQGFDFNGSWGGPTFTLHNGESQDSGPLAPGVYSVLETAIPNWLTTVSQNPLAIVVTANVTTTITFTNRKQSGYLLARDLATWGDRGTQGDPAAGDADLYTQCFVTVGSIQLSTPGSQLMEVRHIVGYFDAVGTLGTGGAPSQPFVSVLPNEIAAVNGAQFINLPSVIQEPPYGATASRSLQQLRWPLNEWSDDSTSLLMHHLQVKLLFAPENAPNCIKMLVVKSDQE